MTVMRAENDLEAPSAVIENYLRKTVSISYLFGLAWAGRLIIIACAILGSLYGIYTVYAAGPYYTAMMRISPASSDTSAGSLGEAGGLLAGLTGGGSGAAQVPKYIQFIYALSSIEVARILDQKYDLLCRVYKSECHLMTHHWEPRTGLKEWVESMTARLSGLPDPNVGPRSAADLARYVAFNVTVEQTKKTDSVNTLTFTHSDPKFAATFLSLVVKATNDYIRTQSRETQKRYVEYLSASAAKVANVEQRQAIDTLLLQEERQLMMTEVDVPYAANILDGPTVTPVNKVLKTIALYTAMGLVLGLAVAMSRDLLPRKLRKW